MSKVKRPRKATLKDAAADLKALKAKVRKKVSNGQPLSHAGRDKNLEAREVQMKIASLEAKAVQAASAATDEKSAGNEQKTRKQMEALRRRLKP